ncbi:MAG: DUF4290 domain-containing protein [Bacteroidetes bacterium]|nr:DUF4290 domain-containing protein [Bacteroidota bacterium]
MEYNTARKYLDMPEYGRNIQKMILYTITIEDKEKRFKVAQVIVNIMSQMHPKMREMADYKHKLWDHLYIISEWKINVEGPYPPPLKEVLYSKPDKIPYSSGKIRFKPYGKNIERMIDKAILLEDGPGKDLLMKIIANHLKKSYLNWNRDSVNDGLILKHFDELSDGKLKLDDDFKLAETSDILARKRKKKFTSKPRDNNYGYKNKNRKNKPTQ